MKKSTRFNVLKRDGFICQYCGRTPPEVTLEVDHINPRSNHGIEDLNNYITACLDCNQGKGKKLLTEIPHSLKDNLKKLKEKQEQLDAYNQYLKNQEKHFAKDIRQINKLFIDSFPEFTLKSRFRKGTLRRFLGLLPPTQVEHAMAQACSQMAGEPDRAIQYFCGICWNWIKKPETRDW